MGVGVRVCFCVWQVVVCEDIGGVYVYLSVLVRV